jgi:single-strand DNA-binding protein
MNLNKVFLIGRMAADPEVRTTPSGQQVATIRIATNRVWNDKNNQKQEQVEFHTVVAWGRLAEIAQKYLLKGQLAFFEGRLQTRSWQGQDGVKRYRTEIVAESLQLGPKAANAPYQSTGQPRSSAPVQSSQSSQLKSFNSKDDDEIPVIDQEAPVSNPIATDNDVEETEIDLKDIPF